MNIIRKFINVVVVGVVIIAVVIVLNGLGLFDFMFSNERQDKAQTTGVAEVRVRPLDLPCKVRIDATVPVKAEAKYTLHSFVGSLTVNTDTVWMKAIGDVDTCFPATGATVKQTGQDWDVQIDARQTVFNRPRVKPAATASSVNYEPGAGRRLVNFVPIIDYFVIEENGSRLTLEAQAFTQSVIGGSTCMKAAWPATKQAIRATYLAEAKRKGIAPSHVQVTFNGLPKFTQNDMKRIPKEFGDTKFSVNNDDTKCRLVN